MKADPNAVALTEADVPPRGIRIAVALAAAAVMLSAAWVLIFSGAEENRSAYDQNIYHLEAIRIFAEQWPQFDISDYLSATTPGYHIVLATVHRFVSGQVNVLRACGALFAGALIFFHCFWLSGRVRPAHAALLTLPLIASLYVLASAAWLLPDDLGWLAVVLCMALALEARCSRTTLIGLALAFTLLIWVRQSHAWVVFPIVVAAWWRGPCCLAGRGPGDALRGKSVALVEVGVALLPGAVSLLGLMYLWNWGLVPPMFQGYYSGIGYAAPVLVLAILGLASLPLAGWVFADARDGGKVAGRWGRAELIVGVVGLIACAAVHTDFNPPAGRMSGIWNVVERLPVIASRSPLMIVLGTFGGVMLVRWLRAMGRAERWIMLAALLAFIASQVLAGRIWQRYSEPLILIWVTMAIALIPRRPKPWAWFGVVTLALALAAISVLKIH